MPKLTAVLTILAGLLVPGAAWAQANAPEPHGPVPSPAQKRWHEIEFFGLICYGPNTHTGQTWGYGDVDPAVVNPPDLDTDQWAKTAHDGGMRGLILVAKHHDGFCLWPSKTTKYTIAAAPWKDGKGDILGDLAASCKKFGLKLGVYISPWDRNHAEYGREGYIKDFHEQWREVLEYDDDIFEFWLDGANGGTGYYGGAREKRSIPHDYYQEEKIVEICQAKHPLSVFFNISRKKDGVRWIGNERGTVPEQHWCRYPSKMPPGKNKDLKGTGSKTGDIWLPAEADTPFQPGWYWSKKRGDKNFKWLLDTWYGTVGRGAVFNLGVGPNDQGLMTSATVEALKQLKAHVDRVFAVNLVAGAAVTADNVRGKADAFVPARALDDTTDTYWATDDGVGRAVLTVDFGKPTAFDHLMMQEPIQLGQRIHGFTLEQEQGGAWKAVTRGTTVGYKKIMKFAPVTATRVRVTLETDAPCVTLATFGLYDGSGSAEQAPSKTADAPKATGTSLRVLSSPPPAAGRKPAAMVDGDPKSWWAPTAADAPLEIVIDLGTARAIPGFFYTKVEGAEENQNPAFEYAFHVSADGKAWGKPVDEGEFSNIEADEDARRDVHFDAPVTGRYVKFTIRSCTGDLPAGIAELGVLGGK
jgi:alpha-L-fucosidase